MSGMFSADFESIDDKVIAKDVKLSEIENQHIIRTAIAQNPFFHFDKLSKYFPNIPSTSFFINDKNYLGNLEIAFIGNKKRLENISNKDYLLAIQSLLSTIENEIKANVTQYEGSDYIHKKVHEVFRDKPLRINKYDERADGQESLVVNEPWYVYNANYGTSEEKDFVKMFAKRFESLDKKFDNIFLIRNEREIKIIDKLGRAFEPDFLLFCKQKEGEELTFQVFIEPKGGHLISHDKWKEDFLKELEGEKRIIKINTDRYRITGVPFYNNKIENDFKKSLESVLEV